VCLCYILVLVYSVATNTFIMVCHLMGMMAVLIIIVIVARNFAVLAWQLCQLHPLLSHAGPQLCFQGQGACTVCRAPDRQLLVEVQQEYWCRWSSWCHVPVLCVLAGLLLYAFGEWCTGSWENRWQTPVQWHDRCLYKNHQVRWCTWPVPWLCDIMCRHHCLSRLLFWFLWFTEANHTWRKCWTSCFIPSWIWLVFYFSDRCQIFSLYFL